MSDKPRDNGGPAWLRLTMLRCVELLALPRNWDSYGAEPISPELTWTALQLLRCFMRDGMSRPKIVPTNRGGVQLEWHQDGIDLEVEIVSQRELRVVLGHVISGATWEGQFMLAERDKGESAP